MQLADYLQILWKFKWVIVLTTAVTLGMAALGIWQTDPEYRAVARLRFTTLLRGSTDYIEPDIAYSERILNTFAELAGSGPVRSAVLNQLRLEELPDYEVRLVDDTELIDVVVDTDEAQLAIDVATSVANVLALADRSALRDLFANMELIPGDTPLVTIVELPTEASTVGTNTTSFLVFGLLAGLVGGAGLAFVLHHFDARVHSNEHLEQLAKARVVGEIPKVGRIRERGVWFHVYPYSEAFRRLRANLLSLMSQQDCTVLVIAGAESGEGASTIAANLALSIAQTGKSVVLIDADMRSPVQHEIFQIPNEVGLSTLLEERLDPQYVIQATRSSRFSILPAGKPSPYATELLHSPDLAKVIAQLRQVYNIIIIDAPPAAMLTDMAVLALAADAVLLVTSQGRTHRDAVMRVARQLEIVNRKLIGLVVNRAKMPLPRGAGVEAAGQTQLSVWTFVGAEDENTTVIGDEDETMSAVATLAAPRKRAQSR